MSKESKKKRFHNQPDNPGVDFDQPVQLPGLTAESKSRGWIWDIDIEGVLVACSPDIEDLIGFKKEDVIGSLLSSFSNFNLSSLDNEKSFSNTSYPFYLEIVFKKSSGEETKFSTQIFPRMEDEGNLFGWRGISIALTSEKNIASAEPDNILIPSLNELLELDEVPLPETNHVQSMEESPESEDVTGQLKLKQEIIQDKTDQTDALDKNDGEIEELKAGELQESGYADLIVERSRDVEDLREMTEHDALIEEIPDSIQPEAEIEQVEGLSDPAKTAPLFLTEDDIARLAQYQTAEEIVSHSQDKTNLEEEKEELIQTPIEENMEIETTSPPITAPLILDPEKEEAFLAQIATSENAVDEILNFIDSDPARIWEEDDLLLVNQIADQLSQALENANLFQQTQLAYSETDEQARRLQILNRMGEELGQTSSLQEIFDLSIEKTQKIFQADRVSLALLTPNKDGVTIVSSLGERDNLSKGSILPLKGTANQTAIEENRIIINSNIDQENLGEIRSFILGPVSISGEIIGTLNVGSYSSVEFSSSDENFMAQLLALLSSVIENRRLFEAIEEALSTTEEQARRLSLLNTLSERLGRANTFDDVISITMEDIDKIIPANRCGTAIYDKTKDCFQVFAIKGDGNAIPLGSDVPVDNTLMGLVKRENRLHSIENLLEVSYVDTRELADEGLRSIMVAPLFASGQVIGTLNIGKNETHAYTSQDEYLLLSISSLVASTIDNRQLFSQIQRRSIQLETSAEVSRIASTILDTYELLPRVVELIKDGFILTYAGLFLIDQNGDWTGEPNKWAVLRAGSGEAGKQMMEAGHKLEIGGDSMIGAAVSNAEARIALDVGEEARFFRNPYLPDTRSEMALPLISRGEVLGALSIQSEKEAAFSQEDITALQTMADQVANTIENAHLFEQSEIRAEELTVLNEMARAYTQTMDINILIEHTHDYVGRLMDASNFYLAFYDATHEEIEFKLFVDEGPESPAPNTKFKLGGGITDWVISNKQPLLLRDNVAEQMEELGIPVRGGESASYLGVPMMSGNRVIGMIAVQSYKNPSAFTSHHLDLLSAISNQATVAIENAQLFHQEQKRAEQERLVRTITDKVRRGANAQSIMRIALEELGQLLGADVSTIHLGTKEQLLIQLSSGNSNQLENPEIFEEE
jgi:GAF domain-containing protein